MFEDEVAEDPSATAHARRASSAGRYNTQTQTQTQIQTQTQVQASVPETQYERGVGLLRRLSLGSALAKPPTRDILRPQSPPRPQAPPNSAVTNTPVVSHALPGRKARRSTTIADSGRPRRAPSPMGERMLKGHFDSFN